ncbi:ankyrin repeat domain-containing protein, partial [Anaerobiospirillum sp. NML120448]
MIGNFKSLDPLLEAVYRNDTDSIEQLLSQGVSLNTPIELSHNIKITPLELAIITNNIKLCSFLIDHGASLEDQLKILWDFFNHTILHQNKSTIYFDASNNFYKTLCMRCLNGT